MLLALSGEFAKRRERTEGPHMFSSCTSSTIWQSQFKAQEKKKKKNSHDTSVLLFPGKSNNTFGKGVFYSKIIIK